MSLIKDVLESLRQDYGTTVTVSKTTVTTDDDFTASVQEKVTIQDSLKAIVLESSFARQFLRSVGATLPVAGTVCLVLAKDITCLQTLDKDCEVTIRNKIFPVGEVTELGIGDNVEAYAIETKNTYEVRNG